MRVEGTDKVVGCVISVRVEWGMAEDGGSARCTDVGAGEQKTTSVLEGLARRQRKAARLKCEAAAADRKALQQKRLAEEASRKRQRDRSTMHSYFATSRNAEDRATALDRRGSGVGDGGVGEGDCLAAIELLHLGDIAHAPGGEGEPDVTIELSIPAIVNVTSDSTDPTTFVRETALPSESEEPDLDVSDYDLSEVEGRLSPARCGKKRRTEKGRKAGMEEVVPVGGKRWKKTYDLTRKYQMEWAAKAPWSEGVLRSDGLLHLVKCTICSTVGRKPCLMAPKWDTISRHGLRKCHAKNQLLYASRRPSTVLDLIQGCTSAESRRKRVQFATLFHVLCCGRPMREYTARFELYKFLGVPDLPTSHWCAGSGWIMAEHIYDFVKKRQAAMIHAANYIALSADESSTIDNQSVIVIHCYVLCDWGRQSLMIALSKLESDGATADSLTKVIMSALLVNCGLEASAIASKLLCFGADGVAAFQGRKNGVTTQIKGEFAPFANGQHCCAHKLQLAAQVLSETELMSTAEDVLQTSHAYFAHSPKRVSEFRTLALLMETKGLKLLKNVKTRWISCHAPMRRLISEWKPVMAKMFEDGNRKKGGKKARVSHFGAQLFDIPHCFFLF